MKDPVIVTDSIINSDGTQAGSVHIYPVTIFRYAWLERLESPFIDPSKKFDVNSIIPTAYVFCSTPDELRKYTTGDVEKFKNDAFAWADKVLDLDDLPMLIKSITNQMTALNKAAPAAVPDSGVETQDGTKKK